MERQVPTSLTEEIDLYIRTYYLLLRSSGDVRVRSFEESHQAMGASLHSGAGETAPDFSAFGYSAARLPDCIPTIQRLVLGQSIEVFEAAGYRDIRKWTVVKARGRRRPMRTDGLGTLAVFIASTSDIDDLVPIVTAYQIEWNKIHERLVLSGGAGWILSGPEKARPDLNGRLAQALGLEPEEVGKLHDAWGERFSDNLRLVARQAIDLRMRLLAGSFSQYQRAAQRWWRNVEKVYLAGGRGRRHPVYFISSNTHSLANLLGGYAGSHGEEVASFARERDPEGLSGILEEAESEGNEKELNNLRYYMLRAWTDDEDGGDQARRVQAWEAERGIRRVSDPRHIDVGAQVIRLSELRPEAFDPRIRMEGLEGLARSEAVIINIDYPLGMAAYHLMAVLGNGVGELRGIYVMGKAATLNARVGDVLISDVIHDEHSRNTYLFRNCFSAADVAPYLLHGTVFDNQKALTVRGAFLQNRDYMGIFYREGYTVIEMEAGPYLSAAYEMISPKRHPVDEIVKLFVQVPFDIGFLHYASDTPYSRRQSLLSKSLSYFGMDSAYAASAAILRHIFNQELARTAAPSRADLPAGREPE